MNILKTILVNKENRIKDSYFKKINLVDTINFEGKRIQVEKEAYDAYIRLKDFLATKHIFIDLDEGYRSIKQQKQIHDEFLIKYGEKYTQKFVASPYESEHHTGLALDLVLKVNGEYILENEDLFQQEEIWKEIFPFLKDYGFILRYPKKKENITKYPYEPWHIRYVGVAPATIIYQNNFTLEEYLQKFSGVLVVNKEAGMTSRDVVNKVSKILGIKKIGHTGTLDPMAEGVLVLTIGKATKIGDLLTSYEKEYVAEVKVGILTDTLDTTGKIRKEKELNSKINYQKLVKSFEKTYLQEVPIYSAVKVGGKKLYEYARKGEEVNIPKKEVTIKSMTLLREEKEGFTFQCLVSKGTYIRSLIRDMGDSVKEYFTMSHLTRTKQGNFTIESSYTLKDIQKGHFKILTIEEALSHLPIRIVEKEELKKVSNGVRIPCKEKEIDRVILKDKESRLLVIYKGEGTYLKIDKMIYNTLNN